MPAAHKSVRWSSSFWGASVASTAWKIATGGFAWYATSGLGRYQLIYGSLGAVVALLFLIYLIAVITLFGAHPRLGTATEPNSPHEFIDPVKRGPSEYARRGPDIAGLLRPGEELSGNGDLAAILRCAI